MKGPTLFDNTDDGFILPYFANRIGAKKWHSRRGSPIINFNEHISWTRRLAHGLSIDYDWEPWTAQSGWSNYASGTAATELLTQYNDAYRTNFENLAPILETKQASEVYVYSYPTMWIQNATQCIGNWTEWQDRQRRVFDQAQAEGVLPYLRRAGWGVQVPIYFNQTLSWTTPALTTGNQNYQNAVTNISAMCREYEIGHKIIMHMQCASQPWPADQLYAVMKHCYENGGMQWQYDDNDQLVYAPAGGLLPYPNALGDSDYADLIIETLKTILSEQNDGEGIPYMPTPSVVMLSEPTEPTALQTLYRDDSLIAALDLQDNRAEYGLQPARGLGTGYQKCYAPPLRDYDVTGANGTLIMAEDLSVDDGPNEKRALRFNGTSQCAWETFPFGNSEWTVALAFRRDGNPDADEYVVSSWNQGHGQFWFAVQSNGTMQLRVSRNQPSNFYSDFFFATVVCDNEWHILVAEMFENNVKAWIDGTQVLDEESPSQSDTATSPLLMLAAADLLTANGIEGHFGGDLSLFKLFTRQLTADERAAIEAQAGF